MKIEKKNDAIYKHLNSEGFVYDTILGRVVRYDEIEKRWGKSSEEEIIRKVHFFLPDISTNASKEIVKKYLILNRAEFARHKYFGFSNLFIDLETGVKKEYSRNTYVMPDVDYPYVENQSPDLFRKTIEEIFEGDEEKIELLLSSFALALDNNICGPSIFIFEGSGANGKSLLLNVLKAVIGQSRISHFSIKDFGEKFRLSILIEPNLVFYEENISTIQSDQMNNLKGVSDGIDMPIEEKHEKPKVYRVKVASIFAMNEKPKFQEKNHAVLRRFHYLEFSRTFSRDEQNVNLLSDLQVENSGIFDLIYEQFRKIRERGSIPVSKTLQEKAMIAFEVYDSVEGFVKSRCIVSGDSEDRISKDDLYNHYKKFCSKKEIEPLGKQTFQKNLLNSFDSIKTDRIKSKVNKERPHCVSGLKLKKPVNGGRKKRVRKKS